MMMHPRWRRVAEVVVVVALLSGAATLLFGGLGASSFHDGDEALYADIAREMAQQHAWLTPVYWGTHFLHKPPLPYWLMMMSSALPGTREFDARVPSAAAALLTLLLVYVSARRLAGVAAALFATALLALNHQWLFEHAARSASFDALLTLLMFAAVITGMKAEERRGWGVVSVLLLGATALVKAPMVIFPAFAIVLHAWQRERRAALRFAVRGLAGVLLVALPWHLYQLIVHGSEFWSQYVVYEIFGRMGNTVRDETAGPLVHLGAAWWSFLPWSPLIAVALAAGVAGWPRGSDDKSNARVRVLAIYALSMLVFFCFIPAKWPWYAIPAYPALAVVTAVFVRRCADARAHRVFNVGLAALSLASALWLGSNEDYHPAARPSFQWPAQEAFYTWGHGPRGVFFVLSVLVLAAAVLALLPFAKRARRPDSMLTLAALVLVLALNTRAVRLVPRAYTSALSGLASEVEGVNFARLYAVGFRHVPWYGNTIEPIASYYLLGIRRVDVTDCGADLTCLGDRGSTACALVVGSQGLDEDVRRAVAMRAAQLSPALQTWVVQSPARYYKLSPGATP